MFQRLVHLIDEGFDVAVRIAVLPDSGLTAVPVGRMRAVVVASPAYLQRHGTPKKPQDLLQHICLRGRFNSGAMPPWEFEHKGKKVVVEPNGPLIVNLGAGADLKVDAAVGGAGLVYLFEDWLQPHFERGELVPVLQRWWPAFEGPMLYYPGRRYLPAPLRAFVDFIQAIRW